MASIKKRKTDWQITVSLGRDPVGKQRLLYKCLPVQIPKREVQSIAAEFELECRRNITGALNSGTPLNELIDYWLRHEAVNHSDTSKQREQGLLIRIRQSIGHLQIGKLAPKHILAFIEALKESPRLDGKPGTISPRAVYMHYSLLRAILNKAKRWQFVANNPCDFVDPPKYRSSRIHIWQEQDLAKFMHLITTSDVPPHQRLFFILAFTTGLRRSELCGIRIENIDLDSSTILINNATVVVKGNYIQKEPKTDASMTKVSISPLAKLYLVQYLDLQEEIHGTTIEYLFTNVEGHQYHSDTFKTWLARFYKSNSLPTITVHAFRHMAITYALKEGYDIKHVSQFARHSKVSTTMNIYAEVLQSTSAALTTSLDKYIRGGCNRMRFYRILVAVPLKYKKHQDI